LATGHPDQALVLVDQRSNTRGAEVRAVAVQAAFACRNVDRAREIVERWQPESEPRAALHRAIWRAAVQYSTGSRRAGLRALADTVSLPEAHHHLRLFIDSGPHVLRLLAEAASAHPDPRLLRIAEEAEAEPIAERPINGSLPPSLSRRELEVVRYLPTRLSAEEIAGRLYISHNTLKTHMRSIYRKFGVSSRDELVTAAEQYGMA
jgi:LuxR family maltose regulon positive regulatory protein